MRRGWVLGLAVWVWVPDAGWAAFERTPWDAESGGRGDTGIGHPAEHGRVFGNPAELGFACGVPFRATSASLYGIPSLGWVNLSGGRCLGRGGVRVSLAQLGADGYREITFGTAIGRRFGDLAGGAALRVLDLEIDSVERRWDMVLDLGVLRCFTKGFAIGAVALGLGPSAGRVRGGLCAPTLGLGGSIVTGDGVVALLDAEQSAGGPRRMRLGFEVPLGSVGTLRGGRVTEPAEAALGVGMERAGVSVDVSVQWHAVLGFSYRTTVSLGCGERANGRLRDCGTASNTREP